MMLSGSSFLGGGGSLAAIIFYGFYDWEGGSVVSKDSQDCAIALGD